MKQLWIVLLGLTSVPSLAVWDLPNVRDGLTLGVQAGLSPNLVQNDTRFLYTGGDFDGKISTTLAEIDRRESDRRLRLSGVGEAYVGVHATQNLARYLKLSGSVAISGNAEGVQAYPSELTLIHEKLGSVSLGAQTSLASAAVATSQNYPLLDQEGSRIEATYTGMPNLSLSAYHAFAAGQDTRDPSDVALQKGQGLSGSYLIDFAPRHTLSLHAGASVGKRHVDLANNLFAREQHAKAVGITYRHDDIQLAVDGGYAHEYLSGANISKIDKQAFGASLSYDITPRTQAYVRAGKLQSKKTGDNINIDAIVAAGQGINETHLFDSVEQTRMTAGVIHKVHATTTLNANIERTQTKNTLNGQDFSKRTSVMYGAGISFWF